MTASNVIFFLVPETATGTLCNCLVGAESYAHYVISPPLRGVKVLPSTQHGLTRPQSQLPPKYKNEKKRYPGGLGHEMRRILQGGAGRARSEEKREPRAPSSRQTAGVVPRTCMCATSLGGRYRYPLQPRSYIPPTSFMPARPEMTPFPTFPRNVLSWRYLPGQGRAVRGESNRMVADEQTHSVKDSEKKKSRKQ